ncbi:MAG: hypothetical protein P4M04_04020 [Acidobacteriota bacterium]|nr:hypothetical protein [Acidobacteriota bacterium]
MPATPIRIVVESDPLRSLGLHTIFSDDPDFQLRASSIPEILNGGAGDVILIPANHGSSFSSAMTAVKSVMPSARVLVTGSGQQDEDILRAISAGAKGYVREDAAPEEFK